jgi:ribosomal protein L12E/L44/L45/RPP1/RPP2
MHLGSKHRDTLERIFRHPASGNIEWRQVTSLLEAVGATTEEDAGDLTVTLAGETEVLRRPHGKDIDEQMIVDLRRMFARAGFAPAAESAQAMGGSPDAHPSPQWKAEADADEEAR